MGGGAKTLLGREWAQVNCLCETKAESCAAAIPGVKANLHRARELLLLAEVTLCHF